VEVEEGEGKREEEEEQEAEGEQEQEDVKEEPGTEVEDGARGEGAVEEHARERHRVGTD